MASSRSYCALNMIRTSDLFRGRLFVFLLSFKTRLVIWIVFWGPERALFSPSSDCSFFLSVFSIF